MWRHRYCQISCVLLATLATGCTLLIGRGGHQIRGQIVSPATGQPLECTDPLVVLAIPVSGTLTPRVKTAVIRPVDDVLKPSLLVLPVAQSVRFVNDDDIYHSFFSSSEHNAFDLGLLDPGKSNTMRFERTGPVHVYCSLHTGEEVTILVAETPHYAIVDRSGAFTIRNLPPGIYVLETWSEDLPPQRTEVDVSSGSAGLVELPVGEIELQGSG